MISKLWAMGIKAAGGDKEDLARDAERSLRLDHLRHGAKLLTEIYLKTWYRVLKVFGSEVQEHIQDVYKTYAASSSPLAGYKLSLLFRQLHSECQHPLSDSLLRFKS